MKFKEWLLNNWNELRKDTEHFSDDEHKELDLENNSWWINYSHERPLDSWDRLFALYLLDVYPDCVYKTWDEVKDLEDIKDFSNNGFEGNKAYNNYEREWLSDKDAWDAMTNVAKQGRERVLVDSYDDDGWFGAS